MKKYKRPFIPILFFLYMSLMIFFFYFSQKIHKNRNLEKLNIIIDPLSKNHFLNEEIIKNILFPRIEKIEKKIGQLCILKMEQKLNNSPFIKKSEVFLSVDGILNIKVWQKEPILRIKNGNEEYYLTKDAENLKLSSFYSSKVLLAKGSFSKEEKKHLSDLVQTINSDELLKNQIIGIKKTDLFILIPKIGNHHIILGNLKDFKIKLNKLKAFYKQYLNKIDINRYKSIDLQYKDQVVAKKR
ncbi:MAG: cell division protein FtsQ [Flavobacteriales bacterium]|uniref:cell division protein FtsQ/DivIB n=1 Tax=Blattabacterium sp. (Mastotermes darwiniensis) TaxID=39768 RepID=UPI000231DF99|nr:cell division protein FtsQ [Blattabacterium sp. (Mastotermes darwiniensis)]AER40433.1 cell division protein FtsQ [Blattabacterium sp. (Mastotermes darwiniensis) str. MADAR]MDR1804845.1 cell division protein FtsQ [Flavobacteriales bacterium]